MEKEIIETVLTEMLQELKHLNKSSTDNTNVATENAKKLNAIEKKLTAKTQRNLRSTLLLWSS